MARVALIAVISKESLPSAQQAAVTQIEAFRPEARKGVTIWSTDLWEGTIAVITNPGNRTHFVGPEGHPHTSSRH